jgi:TolA-binding protein
MSDKRTQDESESLTATARVSLYCTASEKEQWTTEAERAGYSSRSEYLFELIQESRRYRAKGFLSREQKQDEIRRLNSKIERLEAELENEANQGRALIQSLENAELAKRVLSTQYQPLHDIVHSLLAHDAVAMDACDLVERALFQLAQRDEVEYQRGHGWRLTEER